MARIIALLFIVCTLTLSGCVGLTPSAMQTTAQAIVAKTISAMNAAKSYNLKTDLTENYTVVQKMESQTFTDIWEWKSQRTVDVSNQEMCLSMDIHETPDLQPYIFQQYLVVRWSYYSQSSPIIGGLNNPWMKTQLNEQYNATWSNFAQVNPQIELLKTSTDINLVGTEQINGTDCYIIQLSPSAEAATDWVLSQGGFPGPSLGWWWGTSPERVKQIDIKAYTNGSVKLWINKDNDLIYKIDINISLDAEPGNVVCSDTGLACQDGKGNSADIGFEKIIRDFSGQWEFSDYNQPVQIQLPPEALNAQNVGN